MSDDGKSVLDVYNEIVDDIENGEHVDSQWIVDSFDLAGYELKTKENT